MLADKMTKRFDWRIFFILLGAATLGGIAVLPYAFELQADALAQVPIPLNLLIPLQIVQNTVLFAVVIALGLAAANRVGLGPPMLEAKLAGRSIRAHVRSILPRCILLGVVVSIAIIVLDLYVFSPALTAELGGPYSALSLQSAQPAAWKGFLASFYGGINEEILLRLFLMSVLVWLGGFIHKTPEGKPTITTIWIANILAAILFGLGHLPATALLLPLTALVILRAIVLNGIAGVAFGYLYARHGLESAMLAHFTADIVLHVLLAL
jgi:membrane protease YdiL (CAAX protease family)